MSAGDSDLKELRSHALRLLARRPYSTHQLQQKLLRRFPAPSVEALVDEFVKRRYLDDASLAEERARLLRTRRYWGTQRIRTDLRRLGFDAKIVARATDRAESVLSSEQALKRVMESWTRKNGEPGAVAELKKLFDHCRRRGFATAMVRDLLEPFWSRLGS